MLPEVCHSSLSYRDPSLDPATADYSPPPQCCRQGGNPAGRGWCRNLPLIFRQIHGYGFAPTYQRPRPSHAHEILCPDYPTIVTTADYSPPPPPPAAPPPAAGYRRRPDAGMDRQTPPTSGDAVRGLLEPARES